MKTTHTAPGTRPSAKRSTEEVAHRLAVKPLTMRATHCREGHYLGMVPVKLPNGRLLWDEAEVDALVAGRSVKTPDAEFLAAHATRKAADASKVPAHIRAKTAAKANRLTTGEG